MNLSQATFKLLPLCWVLEHVSLCVHPLRAESMFPTALWHSHMQTLASKPDLLGACFLSAGHLGSGAQRGAQNSCFLEKTFAVVIILSFVVCLAGDVGLDSIMSLPLLPVSLWFFLYICSCGKCIQVSLFNSAL